MKKQIIVVLLLIVSVVNAQIDLKKINVQTLNGIDLPLTNIVKNKTDKPVILFTWSKKWCAPCVEVLRIFDKYYYETLKKENGLKFIALNLDSGLEDGEIKKYIIDKEWYFDVYQDPNGSYFDETGYSSAPQIMLIINGEIIKIDKGFIGSMTEPILTANYIYLLIQSLESRIIYFNDSWKLASKKDAEFVRYVDYIDNKYVVHDRLVATGVLQMSGTYNDKWLQNKTGKFTYYSKNGSISSTDIYSDNKRNGIQKVWHDNGQIWIEEEYDNGKLMNILYLYDSEGNTLNYGSLKNGNGYINRYDENNNITKKISYKNGVLDGKYKDYEKGKEYLFENGKYIKTL